MKLLKCPEKFISPFRIYTYNNKYSSGTRLQVWKLERERRSWESSNPQEKVFLAGSSHEYKLSTMLFCASFSVLKTFFRIFQWNSIRSVASPTLKNKTFPPPPHLFLSKFSGLQIANSLAFSFPLCQSHPNPDKNTEKEHDGLGTVKHLS